MRLYTIGYSKKTAEEFFGILQENGIKQVVDIRRHNSNQLAGFTKQSDLPWFLETIAGIGYTHELALAPSEDLMHAYRKEGLPFDEFADKLRAEFDEREMPKLADASVLLCSEPDPDICHRSVAADYLAKQGDIEVVHL
ncbi:DUF488 domain-containing protein [Corynebacterium fournieri]|uniref:DUF488 domain-containing protein n=1 Tax=Corynebacterium fournieri TaxID=1852390 RepID=UPI000A2F303E|nr:DUF488 domain-containing protein [Corynebacterium fournieri]WJY98574.1 hypothetical protein CFOUR_10980 [Corynebacterium fournieri]